MGPTEPDTAESKKTYSVWPHGVAGPKKPQAKTHLVQKLSSSHEKEARHHDICYVSAWFPHGEGGGTLLAEKW